MSASEFERSVTGNSTSRRDRVVGILNVAVSMCGGSREIMESIINQNKENLESLVIVECGPNLLDPELEEDFWDVKKDRASRRTRRMIQRELLLARRQVIADAEAVAKTYKNKYRVNLVFAEDVDDRNLASRNVQVSSMRSKPRHLIAVAGSNRENDLIKIANSIPADTSKILISDFLFGRPGEHYENIQENARPEVTKARDLKFGSNKIEKDRVYDRIINYLQVFISPACSHYPNGIDSSSLDHSNGLFRVLNAGPGITTINVDSADLTLVYYHATYAWLALDNAGNWHATVNLLENIKLKEAKVPSNELGRALAFNDMLRDDVYNLHTLAEKRGFRNKVLFALGALGIGGTLLGFLTDSHRLAPEAGILDPLGLEEYAQEKEKGGWRPDPGQDTHADDDYVKQLEMKLEAAEKRLEEAGKGDGEGRIEQLEQQVKSLKTRIDDARSEYTAEKKRLDQQIEARNKAITRLEKKIAELHSDAEAAGRAHEEEISAYEAQVSKLKEQLEGKGIISHKKYQSLEERYYKLTKAHQQLNSKLESYQEQVESGEKKQMTLEGRITELKKTLSTCNASLQTLQKDNEQLEKQLADLAGQKEKEYERAVAARYSQKIEELRSEYEKEIRRLEAGHREDLAELREKKDLELKAKIEQIADERTQALAVFNSPVEDLGPYLGTGLTSSDVARYFGDFSDQLSTMYGDSYRLHTVRFGKKTFLKIITDDGRTDFRILEPESEKIFYSRVETLQEQLSQMDQRLDKHIESNNSIAITYTGNIHADIYRAVYEEDPSARDLDNMRRVLRAKMALPAQKSLRHIDPGTRIRIKAR